MKRVEALEQIAFEKKGFDGFLVTNEANLLYLAGFPGTTGLLVPKKGEPTIYVYNVNYEQAKAEGEGFGIKLVGRGEKLLEKIAAQIKEFGIEKLAVDTLNFENHQNLAKRLKGKTKMKMQNELVLDLRKVKDRIELELMRKAGELTSEGMKAAHEAIEPSLREYEVAAEIEYAMRRKGSCGAAFETIVASGARSAFPHGGCTSKKIQKGSLVVVDIGATYKYYRSDMTRTFVTAKPSQKQKRIYEIVKTAQDKSFRAAKTGARAKDVDTAARRVIQNAGYGKYFVHPLGHGVGLEVHEAPALNQESKETLTTGNVVTIEPGIYIVGFGGIRIEDTVLVQGRKAEKFTEGLYTLETG